MSAWTSLLTMPLAVAPFWSRRPAVIAGVLAWFAVNPIMTPEPASRDSFATRAILGEDLWLADPTDDRMITPLNAAGSVIMVGAAVAAWHRRKVPTAIGVAAAMITPLYGWRRYAAIYDADPGDRRR